MRYTGRASLMGEMSVLVGKLEGNSSA